MSLTYTATRLTERFMEPAVIAPARFAQYQKESQRVIAGVSNVPDADLLASLVEGHHKRRSAAQAKYEADARDLYKKCDHAGIPHVRIMPLSAWETLSNAAGLICLAPDSMGKVMISLPIKENELTAVVESRADAIKVSSLLLAALATLSSVAATFLLATSADLPVHGVIAFVGISVLVLSVMVPWTVTKRLLLRTHFNEPSFSKGALTGEGRCKLEHRVFRKLLKNDAKAKQLLFPNLREGTDARIAIELPEAPGEVKDLLLKAAKAGVELHVRAVPEAISFLEDPAEVLVRSRSGVYDAVDVENARKAAALRADPIIETRLGSAVAIIAQYGDFPIEKALIDKIADEEVRFLA